MQIIETINDKKVLILNNEFNELIIINDNPNENIEVTNAIIPGNLYKILTIIPINNINTETPTKAPLNGDSFVIEFDK